MEVKEQVMGARNAMERVMGVIPGYHGYKEKEMRREADKLLRMHLARRLEEERTHLGILQTRLADRGKLKVLVRLERAMLKLQLLIDRMKTAAYGYSGWFDALKVGEKELDALYVFDQSLVDGLEKVSAMIKQVANATEDVVLQAMAEDLLTFLEGLNNTFTRRQDVILAEQSSSKPTASA